MSGKKGNIEFVDQKIEQKEIRKGSIWDVFDGSVLTRDRVVRQLPFVLFVTFLIILYIGNRYHAERVIRQSMELQTELKELRARAISTASELEFISRQSEVVKLVESQGLELKEAVEPPIKITVAGSRKRNEVN
ncbi:FtsL-like putative cell division protein [Bacteroidota bacterium]